MLSSPVSADERLTTLGIILPEVPVPQAHFIPYRREGRLVFLAGQICIWNGDIRYIGRVGVDFTLAEGQAAARICGLNLIAALKVACGGSLNNVAACMRVGGFVNCASDFGDVPEVINGASELFTEIFGEGGAHARTAVGVSSLPRRAAVEVDAIFALKD
jgi:enamine deaminase RidA (YjgF/YER057c/UK114 family)